MYGPCHFSRHIVVTGNLFQWPHLITYFFLYFCSWQCKESGKSSEIARLLRTYATFPPKGEKDIVGRTEWWGKGAKTYVVDSHRENVQFAIVLIIHRSVRWKTSPSLPNAEWYLQTNHWGLRLTGMKRLIFISFLQSVEVQLCSSCQPLRPKIVCSVRMLLLIYFLDRLYDTQQSVISFGVYIIIIRTHGGMAGSGIQRYAPTVRQIWYWRHVQYGIYSSVCQNEKD